MDKKIAEEIFIAGWMAAATEYGGPAKDQEEEKEDAKEAFEAFYSSRKEQ